MVVKQRKRIQLSVKREYCQQSVNILSIADNNGTICHLWSLGTHIALMLSEVRTSDEGNERSLRTTEELRTNKELIDN